MNSKTFKLFFTSLALLTLVAAHGNSRSYKDSSSMSTDQSISYDLSFNQDSSDNTLFVYNVYGSIDVEGYDGDEIEIRAEKTVWGKTQLDINEGLEEIQLLNYTKDQRMVVYLDTPFTYFDKDKMRYGHYNNNHDEWPNYEYIINITVRVPKNTNLYLSAINKGHIMVQDVHAKLFRVSNINGSIDMVDVSGTTKANTINKDINISYRENPFEDSSYETVNGDLNVTFANEPDADITFKTMNGDFYTHFDVQNVGPKLLKTSKQHKRGVKYKFDTENRLKMGNGGTKYTFKTLNGDIYVK